MSARKKKLFKGQAAINIIAMIILIFNFSFLYDNSRINFYDSKAADLFFNSDLENCDCIFLSQNISFSAAEDTYSLELYKSDLLEMYHSNPVVDKVYGFDKANSVYNKSLIELYTAYPETYDLINSELSEGKWFADSEEPVDYPNAVVCGQIFRNVNIGDIITLNSYYYDTYEFESSEDIIGNMKVRVIGKIQYPYYSPDFVSPFGTNDAYAKFSSSASVFLLHDQKTVSALKKASFRADPAYTLVYVNYKTDDEKSISDFRDFINNLYVSDSAPYDNISPVSKFTKPDYKFSQPYLIGNIFYPFNLGHVFLGCILISGVIIFTIRKKSVNSNVQNNLSLSGITANILMLSTIPIIINSLLYIISHLSKLAYDNIIDIKYIAEYFSSEYTIFIGISVFIFWVMVNLLSMIVPVIKLNSLKNSNKKTIDSYTYRPPEYYTEYESRDFEQSKNTSAPSDSTNSNKQ